MTNNLEAFLVYGRLFIFVGTVDFSTSSIFPFLALDTGPCIHFRWDDKSNPHVAVNKIAAPTLPVPPPHLGRNYFSFRSDSFFLVVRKSCAKFAWGTLKLLRVCKIFKTNTFHYKIYWTQKLCSKLFMEICSVLHV